MNSGIAIYTGSTTQFSTQYPALMIDRTSKYGYKNYQFTFGSDPAQPAAPTSTNQGTNIFIKLYSIYHGLGYIPAFETVTIGYGLPPQPYAGINFWNEDATLSQGSPTGTDNISVYCQNDLQFRADQENLHIGLYRTAVWDTNYSPAGPAFPFSLAGVQLNINIQIFAMGLNDSLSQV